MGQKPKVLNEGTKPVQCQYKADQLAKELKIKAKRIHSQFYDVKTKGLAYDQIKSSSQYNDYILLSRQLVCINLSELQSPSSKKAFWINLYNALTIHAVIAFEVKKSVLEKNNFFDMAIYYVGQNQFSLNDIEHGILRGNTLHHFKKPFSNQDPRQAFVLTPIDPRIHFALNCASKSCPPISFYDEENLEAQLNLATRNFVESETQIKDSKLHTSKLFDWYALDFKPDVLSFIQAHLPNDLAQKIQPNMPVVFKDYNWNLNQ